MQVSSTAKLLLDIYRDCRILADEHLTMKALITTKLSWHREHQDNFHVALEELIDNGYLDRGNTGFVLTDEGYHFLNKDKLNRCKAAGRRYRH
ncbi:hypothetical protein NBG4_670012 [Candidatus Sulfobium mesophilum]|uniref:Uncharacterized protein n=1 Tax=Candidatus Sulfobium mesophilum TaxID=2016548 RepID=A0A2U3QJW3_9BACT|nr:hypothetical protein NBG4_670012 [Candidatus Sulfobium mesophilum]